MKKQAMERSRTVQQTTAERQTAQPATAGVVQPVQATSVQPAQATAAQPVPNKSITVTSNDAPSATDTAAIPYTLDDAPASPQSAAQTQSPRASQIGTNTLGALAASDDAGDAVDHKASAPPEASLVSVNAQQAKKTDKSDSVASNEAATILGSDPAPNEPLLAEAAAAPTSDTLPTMNDTAAQDKGSEMAMTPARTSAVAATSDDLPASVKDVTATAPDVVKVSTFTAPELTRLQHNTFVSRPTDPSRAAIRDLDLSELPAPLRPIDRKSGIARSPSHVIIFGWMDAPIRLVAKYAQPYTVLFPDATVLVQLSDGKSYLARENVRRQQLQRVIAEINARSSSSELEALQSVQTRDVGDSTVTLIDHKEAKSSASSEVEGGEESEPSGFVIHSFSDGGAGNLALFLDEMAHRPGASPKVYSLIMDSSPGKANPKTGSFAFTMHLANRPRLRVIVRALVYIGLYLLKIWTKLTGQPQRGDLMRKRLNSLKSWSWITASHASKAQGLEVQQKDVEKADYPPRMYMYTKADKLIPWQFVEEHANHLAKLQQIAPGLKQMENATERQSLLSAVQAKGKMEEAVRESRYKVELRRWNTPPHCSIGRADFEGYWAAVIDFYTRVLSRP